MGPAEGLMAAGVNRQKGRVPAGQSRRLQLTWANRRPCRCPEAQHSRQGLRATEQRTWRGGSKSAGKSRGCSYCKDGPTLLHGAHLPLDTETIFTGLREGLPGLAALLRAAHSMGRSPSCHLDRRGYRNGFQRGL